MNEPYTWVGPIIFAFVMVTTFGFVFFIRKFFEWQDEAKQKAKEDFERLHEWRELKLDKRDVVTTLLAQREKLNEQIAKAIKEQNDGHSGDTSPYRNSL